MFEEKGYFCLVLHSHLPFIRHPEYEEFLEEDWLFEAITETYIPIISLSKNLLQDGVDFRITINLSPTLTNMLSDELLINRYKKHLAKLLELSEKELFRTKQLPDFHKSAVMYNEKFKLCFKILESYGFNLINAFKDLDKTEKVELITCGATHGYLPLMITKESRKAQIIMAVRDFKDKFDRPPRGIWIPECAYTDGVDKFLKENGIKFFFLEAHGILYSVPRPRYGVFAPVYTPNGIAAFGRDMESAHQVWSADIGYPGDYRYREFYRDLGYDAAYDYIKPYLHSDGIRRNIGIKYYKITGKVSLDAKQPYDPDTAKETAATHSGNFMFNREKQIEYLYGFLKRKPIIVSMYDAELFGHWWYEGPDFLEFLFRKIHYDQKVFKPITPSEYLNRFPDLQIVEPAMSSWGDKGYYEVWLNGSNDWIYKHLHKAEERMIELATNHQNAEGILLRALNQLARELMLAQASDWAFLMTVGAHVPYAHKRTHDHINNFTSLYYQIKENSINNDFLSSLEWRNNIFKDNMDYRIFSKIK